VAYIYIKREATHRVILCNNVDLCLKNDFETHTLQSAVTHHRLLWLRNITIRDVNRSCL